MIFHNHEFQNWRDNFERTLETIGLSGGGLLCKLDCDAKNYTF